MYKKGSKENIKYHKKNIKKPKKQTNKKQTNKKQQQKNKVKIIKVMKQNK